MSDASTTSTGSLLAALSNDAQAAVAFFGELKQGVATILAKVAAGAEVAIEEFETLCQEIDSNLSLIDSGITATSSLAAAVAPNDATLQKLISDVQTGVNDAAQVSTTLKSGSTAGANSVVTTAVTTLATVNTLAQLAAQAAAAATTAAAASPTATQTTSAPTPNEG